MKGSYEQLKQALEPLAPMKILNGQIKVNCPRCEGELGMEVNKFNLEISYSKNAYHCWACRQHGSLYSVVRKYGHKPFADLFKESSILLPKDNDDDTPLELPKHCMNVLNMPLAANYLLNERRISKQKIRERNVKYCYSGEYKDCIIFPSYDSTNQLNAFVSHNLATKKYKKKKGKNFTCFYESFIDKHSLIITTEGIYDCLVVPNGLPMLGVGLEDETLQVLSNTKSLLIVDNDVNEKVINELLGQLSSVCISTKHHRINQDYQDLNHYHQKNSKGLIEELKPYYM